MNGGVAESTPSAGPLPIAVSGDGPPLVLLHGALVRRTMWDGDVRALRDRHRVVTLDLPAHGEARAVRPEPYTVGAVAALVAECLAAAKVGDAVLCGLTSNRLSF